MRSHDLDAISLVAGVVFGGFGFVYLVDHTTGLTGRWVWPVLLIVIGVVGLLASRHRTDDAPPPPPPPST